MLISVTIPNYNHGRYIGRAIDSILNQSYRNYEIVVVDDGSSDDSISVLTPYANEGLIVLIKLEENYGAAYAERVALSNCKGDLIFGTSADDFICNKDFFLDAVASFNASNIGIFFGKTLLVNSDDSEIFWEMGFAPPSMDRFSAFYRGSLFIPGSSSIVRRDYLKNIGWFPYEFGAQSDFYSYHAIALQYGYFFSEKIYTKMLHAQGTITNSQSYDNTIYIHSKVFLRFSEIADGSISKSSIIQKDLAFIRTKAGDSIFQRFFEDMFDIFIHKRFFVDLSDRDIKFFERLFFISFFRSLRSETYWPYFIFMKDRKFDFYYNLIFFFNVFKIFLNKMVLTLKFLILISLLKFNFFSSKSLKAGFFKIIRITILDYLSKIPPFYRFEIKKIHFFSNLIIKKLDCIEKNIPSS